LAKQLLARATDPETVAKGVNWILSAADHFLKTRRGQVDSDEQTPPPPDLEAGGEETQPPSFPHVKPDLDTFNLEILTTQVESSTEQIQTYVRNLQDLSQQAALHGGDEFAPPIVRNQIRIQRRHIGENLNELAALMNRIYGVQVEGIDKLTEILNLP